MGAPRPLRACTARPVTAPHRASECEQVPSLCEYKGITCDRRRLEAEAVHLAKFPAAVPEKPFPTIGTDEKAMLEELMEDV